MNVLSFLVPINREVRKDFDSDWDVLRNPKLSFVDQKSLHQSRFKSAEYST
ncbi:hypothetical protein PPHE_a0631 [Pseudoalteromonas phenolica O-BC30]|nr:hypothetical protein [Pseudoalteromonas phenolica O-BC30]